MLFQIDSLFNYVEFVFLCHSILPCRYIECDHSTGKITNWCLIENNCKYGNSYGNFLINKRHHCLVFAMCHNFTGLNRLFADHFCNDEIFKSFRIVCTQFLQDNFVTCFDEFKHAIKTAYKDISIIHWKLRYATVEHIVENHHRCKNVVSKLMNGKYQFLQNKIIAMSVMWCLWFWCFLYLLFFFVLFQKMYLNTNFKFLVSFVDVVKHLCGFTHVWLYVFSDLQTVILVPYCNVL